MDTLNLCYFIFFWHFLSFIDVSIGHSMKLKYLVCLVANSDFISLARDRFRAGVHTISTMYGAAIINNRKSSKKGEPPSFVEVNATVEP